MDKNPYTKKMDDLLNNVISEIVVPKEDFFFFRDIWMNHPKKNQVNGEAFLGGKVIYRKIK